MAHAPSDRDESAPAGPPDGDEAGSPKPPGLLLRFFALLSKVPLPSLGSERHEMVLNAAPAEGLEAEPAPTPAPPRAKRAPGRFPFLAMKRETRVGIAALVSFLFLVTALASKKGWIGKPVTLAMAAPEGGPESPASTKAESEPDRARDKDAGQVKKGPRPGPAPKAGDEVKPPAPIPDVPPSSKLTLAGDPAAAEPAAPPPPSPESSKPATLASATQPTFPPAFPSDPPAPAEPPTDPPGSAPLPSIGDPPPSSPPPPPAPAPAPSEPPPTTPDEPPMIPAEAKPSPTEPSRSPGAGLPLIDEPPPMSAPVAEKPRPAPDLAEMAREPNPIPTPAPTPATPPPPAATAPVLAEQPPKLDPVPGGTMESAATKTSAVGAIGPVAAAAGWVSIPSGGRRIVGASPIVSTPSEDRVESPRVADGPRVTDDLAAADQVEPVVHVVRAGENFWTISILYYRSHRFYRALHAANRRQVPKIDELYVGTVLRIPPPEALDRSLIDPPGPTTSPASRAPKRVDPNEGADLAMPAVRPRMIRPDPEAVEAPRRPTYTVKARETLRSIARDTLNDSRRDREIYNLNRDVLDDINVLEPGTTLTLPEDAIVGRRSR